jgi:hypothetical protein
MKTLSSWLLIVYVLAITGIAGYEYAVIERLQWVIRVLLAGSQN